MRLCFAAIAFTVSVSTSVLLAGGANATIGEPTPGVRQAPAKTNAVKQAVVVCRRDATTGQRQCRIDRSRPPTVCHVIEENGRRRLDCY